MYIINMLNIAYKRKIIVLSIMLLYKYLKTKYDIV